MGALDGGGSYGLGIGWGCGGSRCFVCFLFSRGRGECKIERSLKRVVFGSRGDERK